MTKLVLVILKPQEACVSGYKNTTVWILHGGGGEGLCWRTSSADGSVGGRYVNVPVSKF